MGATQPYRQPSEAAAAAQDGDAVEIDPGVYPGDVALWTANRLTIRAPVGAARVEAAGRTCEGKALWVIRGNDTVVEGVEFSGCKAPDRNGAGIRQEGRGLTLRGCRFLDNENGLLTSADAQSDILLERCEFAGNGAGDGQSHNLYIGRVRSLTMIRCYSHGARMGHLLKSRAEANYLFYNRLLDGDGGTSSYLVDLPDGGSSFLVGNLLQHGSLAQNRVAISYGEESAANPSRALLLIDNVFVNERAAGGDFLRLARRSGVVVAANNCTIDAVNSPASVRSLGGKH